jgi:hypothetical protein
MRAPHSPIKETSMNKNLVQLLRMKLEMEEEVMYVLNLVHRIDTNAPDLRRIDRDEFASLHPAILAYARYVIADFTKDGVFDIDGPAKQLGIDTTAEGPTVDDEPHLCTEETIIIDGQYGAPGIGYAAHCAVCQKQWSKVGNTFYEPEAMMHVGTIDDFR